MKSSFYSHSERVHLLREQHKKLVLNQCLTIKFVRYMTSRIEKLNSIDFCQQIISYLIDKFGN